ncbi:MAG: hypothetical protein J0M08_13590 [Bacteroidetes bacterium]|nr:hypothetical protein [Bacteroidota bacterium]
MQKSRLVVLGLSVFFITSLALLVGCDGKGGGKGIREGTIEYDARPIDVNNPLAAYSPTKMIFKFKDSKCKGELSAGMGMLNMAFISNPQKKTFTQQVRIVNQKYYHIYDTIALKKENKAFPKFTLKPSNETKIIAGFKCKKTTIVFEDPKNQSFDIYYTNDIDIEAPNWSSPFKDIEGVLMEYQIVRYGFELRFTAKTVTQNSIKDDQFEISKDYKKVTDQYLTDLFKSFQ